MYILSKYESNGPAQSLKQRNTQWRQRKKWRVIWCLCVCVCLIVCVCVYMCVSICVCTCMCIFHCLNIGSHKTVLGIVSFALSLHGSHVPKLFCFNSLATNALCWANHCQTSRIPHALTYLTLPKVQLMQPEHSILKLSNHISQWVYIFFTYTMSSHNSPKSEDFLILSCVLPYRFLDYILHW